MATYKTVPLYGGAMTIDIPESFQDVSEIRQVPDNQEVYLDSNGYSSIVIDILERVDLPAPDNTDAAAFQFHLRDVAEVEDKKPTSASAGKAVHTWAMNDAVFARISTPSPLAPVQAFTLLATSPGTRAPSPSSPFTALLLTLLRLPTLRTDILITISIPHTPSPSEEPAAAQQPPELDFSQNRVGAAVQRGLEWQARGLASLEIKDWGLFGEG